MRRRHEFIAVVWVCALGCVPEAPEAVDSETLRAQRLLQQLRDDDYRSWPRPEGWADRADASGSHGALLEIFASPDVEAVLVAGETLEAWPPGARFVAEGYDGIDSDPPRLLSVSVKDELGWTWAQYEDDEPVVYGRTVGCVSCHDTGNDLVRSVELPQADQ